MNMNDISINIFNAVTQYKSMTGRSPTRDELLRGILPFGGSGLLAAVLQELTAWGWIQWDGYNTESIVITRPTEVQHNPDDVRRVMEQAEAVLIRRERKTRRQKATEMLSTRKPRPHRFTG